MVNEIITSDIERIVLAWLDKRHIIYEFQSSQMGGRYELGGSIVDVLIHELNLAWRIHGDYWHKPIAKRATDEVQREILESQGWTVVDIWGSDLETPEEVNSTLEKALLGQEVL